MKGSSILCPLWQMEELNIFLIFPSLEWKNEKEKKRRKVSSIINQRRCQWQHQGTRKMFEDRCHFAFLAQPNLPAHTLCLQPLISDLCPEFSDVKVLGKKLSACKNNEQIANFVSSTCQGWVNPLHPALQFSECLKAVWMQGDENWWAQCCVKCMIFLSKLKKI